MRTETQHGNFTIIYIPCGNGTATVEVLRDKHCIVYQHFDEYSSTQAKQFHAACLAMTQAARRVRGLELKLMQAEDERDEAKATIEAFLADDRKALADMQGSNV